MKLKWKHFEAYYSHDKLPRKAKKRIVGYRVSSCKLKRMLKETKAGESITTMYERREFTPHGAFCPKCGHSEYYGGGNMTSYPEHWEYFYCLRCGFKVGAIDNSPFIHALECKEENYIITL